MGARDEVRETGVAQLVNMEGPLLYVHMTVKLWHGIERKNIWRSHHLSQRRIINHREKCSEKTRRVSLANRQEAVIFLKRISKKTYLFATSF